jgi:hypothetical protein
MGHDQTGSSGFSGASARPTPGEVRMRCTLDDGQMTVEVHDGRVDVKLHEDGGPVDARILNGLTPVQAMSLLRCLRRAEGLLKADDG